MNQKADKKYLRPKVHARTMEISAPFAFKHDIHIGLEDFEERCPDELYKFPLSYTPASREDFRQKTSISSSISQVIQNEVIPAIRSEIGDIVEEKIRHILNEFKENPDTRQCQTCLCPVKKVIVEELTRGTKESKDATDNKNITSDEIQEDFDETLSKGIIVHARQNRAEELKDNKSFPTSTNAKESQDVFRHLQHGEKLVKYCSDIQLDQDKHKEKERSQGFKRTRTLPASVYRAIPNKQRLFHTGKALSKTDERICLADALQWHVEELINGIVFKDSELPDNLLADSCLTDEECADLRKTLDCKDQVRILTSIIKGRDLNVLLRFLKQVKSQNEHVARSIEEKFEYNKRNGVRCSECALCNLTSNVNAKYIADRLWKNKLIDSGLYNWVVQSDKPTGVQGEMWRGIIKSLNSHCERHRTYVSQILSSALTKNNHYHHVAEGLEKMINMKGEIYCYCEIRLNTVCGGSFTSLQTSKSPQSSKPECVTDTQSDLVSSLGDINTVALQDQATTRTESDYIKQTGNQSQLTIRSPETTGETCPLSDLHQEKDTVLDDTKDCLKRNIVPEKSTDEFEEPNSSKNTDDNFKPDTYLAGTNDCLKRKSNIVPKKTTSEGEEINLSKKNEENFKSNILLDDTNVFSKSNIVPENSTNELEKTKSSTEKDENFKPTVPQVHLKSFNTQKAHIIVLSYDDLVSSDV